MKIRMGELLVKAGVITADELSQALSEQRLYGGKIGEILVRMNFLSEEVLVRALSKQLDIPRAEIPSTLDPSLLSLLPFELLEDLKVLPVKNDAQVLTVITSDPLNPHARQRLEAASRKKVLYLVGKGTGIAKALVELRQLKGEAVHQQVAGVEEDVFVDNAGRHLLAEAHRNAAPDAAPVREGTQSPYSAPPTQSGLYPSVPSLQAHQGHAQVGSIASQYPGNARGFSSMTPVDSPSAGRPSTHPSAQTHPPQAYPSQTYPSNQTHRSGFAAQPPGFPPGQREGGGLIGQTLPPSYFPYGPSYPYPYSQQTFPPSYPFFPQGASPYGTPAQAPGTEASSRRFLDLEEVQRKESLALRELVELLIDKGVITLDEYLARLKR